MHARREDPALERLPADLALIQRIARVAGWEWNLATGEAMWSDELFALFGMDPATFEPTYDGFVACVHPDDREFVTRTLDRSLDAGDSFRISHRVIRPDGGERLVLCRAQVFRGADGAVERMVGATIDLSDFSQAGEDLQAAHDQLHAAEELAEVGSFDYDAAENRVTWSRGLYRLFGLRPDEFDGTFDAYLARIHPDERAGRRAELEGVVREGGGIESTNRVRRGDGSYAAIHSRVQVESADGGLHLIGVCRRASSQLD